MYKNILVPVDLDHTEQMEKSLRTAALIAKAEDASVTLCNVSGTDFVHPATTPEEYKAALEGYAAQKSSEFGVTFRTISVHSPDPEAELLSRLKSEIEEGGYDLVIMASHVPGFSEYIFASNAGYLASHAKVSVFVVRP